MAKKGQFFGPGGSNFDPFFAIFFKSLVNMPTNIILKNQKNSITRKIFEFEKLRKLSKKGQKSHAEKDTKNSEKVTKMAAKMSLQNW